MAGLSRRQLLGATGVGAGSLVAGAVGAGCADTESTEAADHADARGARTYPFRGDHQAGIVTPAQDRLHFAAFDVVTDDRDELIELLTEWTVAAERMCRGHGAGPVGPTDGAYDAPPDDTGEAIGLPPSGLTITFGFGPSLFDHPEKGDRFGLAAARPKNLINLPHFPGDKLDPRRSDGDLCVQACADDPQVAVHAIRNLVRIGFGTASVRWSQLGFGRTSSTSTSQTTPRNLFGFKDGTANVKAEDHDLLVENVWVSDGDDEAAGWMTGGSYLVARRINMHIETWDRTSLREQEALIGRTKDSGAPLSGGDEFTEPDFELLGRGDVPVVPLNSHMRLAHPDANDGAHLLRRGYNFTDGTDGFGRLDAGLFFLAFVRDPVTQYVPMQTTLARDDALSEYLQHTGSGIWAVPSGIAEGDRYVGEALFA